MGIVGSFKKTRRLVKVSRELGRTALSPPQDITSWFLDELKGGTDSTQEQLDELWNLAQSDRSTRAVLDECACGREEFLDTYKLLIANGAGQWVAGHYVAASALAFGSTLDYTIRSKRSGCFADAVFRLLEYFGNNETGPVS